MTYEENLIVQYLKMNGLKPVLAGNNLFKVFAGLYSGKETIVLSDSRIIRGMCRVLRMNKSSLKALKDVSEIHYAMVDALKVLAAKKIPVLFYNRVGLKQNYEYSTGAKQRIKNEIDFIKMSENKDKYRAELKKLVGAAYSDDYVEKLIKIPQVIQKGNLYCHEDCKTELVNVVEGRRITVPQNDKGKRCIHVYGRCGAFGYAVADSESFPSRLQQQFLENGHNEFSVVNHGIWGGEDNYILNDFLYELSDFKEGDIVIFYMRHFEEPMLSAYRNVNMYYKDITEAWHQMIGTNECFYDKPGHMNKIGYECVAKIIYRDLERLHFTDDYDFRTEDNINAKYLNMYLKQHSNVDFTNEINKYITTICEQNPILNNHLDLTGAIVMNCNPFTKGHRYLVEYAASKVDRLIIFVVEEDKSLFKFEDRYEMVKQGTSDLKNVVVVPSGKFIISTITFPEYFLKDYVKEKNFDMSQDLDTFCKYIAPKLGIKVRFAGAEPFDLVTANYNENMRRILPENGIRFEEIPRMKIDDTGKVINATEVRSLLAAKRIDELKDYIPETTMNIVLDKYLR